jgi:hypothetical protein
MKIKLILILLLSLLAMAPDTSDEPPPPLYMPLVFTSCPIAHMFPTIGFLHLNPHSAYPNKAEIFFGGSEPIVEAKVIDLDANQVLPVWVNRYDGGTEITFELLDPYDCDIYDGEHLYRVRIEFALSTGCQYSFYAEFYPRDSFFYCSPW